MRSGIKGAFSCALGDPVGRGRRSLVRICVGCEQAGDERGGKLLTLMWEKAFCPARGEKTSVSPKKTFTRGSKRIKQAQIESSQQMYKQSWM